MFLFGLETRLCTAVHLFTSARGSSSLGFTCEEVSLGALASSGSSLEEMDGTLVPMKWSKHRQFDDASNQHLWTDFGSRFLRPSGGFVMGQWSSHQVASAVLSDQF